MLHLPEDDPQAVDVIEAIHQGDVARLQGCLRGAPALARSRIVDRRGVARTLLHVAADWPGHFPNVGQTITLLIAAGAEVDAAVAPGRTQGAPETALHWAASSNDVIALDALLDGGANIESPGAIFTNGSPMSDAVVFAQWNAANRLLDRGARTTLWQAAALGLLDVVREQLAESPRPPADQLTSALWHACRGGRLVVAQLLVEQGADLHWVGYDRKTPLDAARDSGDPELIAWLQSRGAASAAGG